MGWGGYREWRPYVSVDQRRLKAEARAKKKAEIQGRAPAPVIAKSSKMTTTFWGRAWCDHLHAFRDYANRLPRGATYLRNGSVVDLVISPGLVEAIVAGSEPYYVTISIRNLEKKRWSELRQKCSASIDSLLDLLAGRLSDGIMRELTSTTTGLFPTPREIEMSCSCPDYSSCCKHLAAVMYGIGVRLDTQPELLFLMRGVDHSELVSEAVSSGNLDRELKAEVPGGLGDADLGELFGIDLAQPVDETPIDASALGRTRKRPVREKSSRGRAARAGSGEKKTAAVEGAIVKVARTRGGRRKAVEPGLVESSPGTGKSDFAGTKTVKTSRGQANAGKRRLKTAIAGSDTVPVEIAETPKRKSGVKRVKQTSSSPARPGKSRAGGERLKGAKSRSDRKMPGQPAGKRKVAEADPETMRRGRRVAPTNSLLTDEVVASPAPGKAKTLRPRKPRRQK